MRSFGIATTRTTPQRLALGQLLARCWVYLAEHDGVVGVADHVALAVLEPQRGVDALLLQPDGFAPRACRILGSHHEVAPVAHIGGNHIVRALMVADGGGVDAQPRRGTLKGQLTLAVQHVAYLLPVHQILGVKDGHAGEILERRVDQIEVVAHPTDRGVGVETGDDGIAQLLCRGSQCTKENG